MTTETKKVKRPWPQWAILILLVVQLVGIGFLGWLHLNTSPIINPTELNIDTAVDAFIDVAALAIALAVIFLFAVLAILSILRWRGNAWMLAMLTQGVTLGVGLVLYSLERPFYTYIIMLYGVIVVVYLMLPGVQAAFLPVGGRR